MQKSQLFVGKLYLKLSFFPSVTFFFPAYVCLLSLGEKEIQNRYQLTIVRDSAISPTTTNQTNDITFPSVFSRVVKVMINATFIIIITYHGIRLCKGLFFSVCGRYINPPSFPSLFLIPQSFCSSLRCIQNAQTTTNVRAPVCRPIRTQAVP